MLSTFQDLLTALLKGSKISFVSIFPSQLNSVRNVLGQQEERQSTCHLDLEMWERRGKKQHNLNFIRK